MPELAIAMDLQEGDQLAWAFANSSSENLRAEAKEYISRIRNNGKLDQILERYYGHTDEFDYVGTRIFIRHHDVRLSNYIDLFETAGLDRKSVV